MKTLKLATKLLHIASLITNRRFITYFRDESCRYNITAGQLHAVLRTDLINAMVAFAGNDSKEHAPIIDASTKLISVAKGLLDQSGEKLSKSNQVYRLPRKCIVHAHIYRDFSGRSMERLAHELSEVDFANGEVKDTVLSFIIAFGNYVEARHTLRYGLLNDEYDHALSGFIQEQGEDWLLNISSYKILSELILDIDVITESRQNLLVVMNLETASYSIVASNKPINSNQYAADGVALIEFFETHGDSELLTSSTSIEPTRVVVN